MIGSKYGKSPAQVSLRWLIQKDIVPVVKSTHEERMCENKDIFDFSLTKEEMETVDSIPECGGMNMDPENPRRDY